MITKIESLEPPQMEVSLVNQYDINNTELCKTLEEYSALGEEQVKEEELITKDENHEEESLNDQEKASIPTCEACGKTFKFRKNMLAHPQLMIH